MKLEQGLNRAVKQVHKVFKGIERDVNKAIAATLNKTAKSALSHAMREFREHYNVKADVLKKLTGIEKATYRNLEVVIRFHEKQLGIQYFDSKQTKKGVTYRIKKGKRQLAKSAFRVKIDAKSRGVFKRTTKKRLPIVKLYAGVNPAKVMTTDESLDRMTEDFYKIYEKYFDSTLEYFLSK